MCLKTYLRYLRKPESQDTQYICLEAKYPFKVESLLTVTDRSVDKKEINTALKLNHSTYFYTFKSEVAPYCNVQVIYMNDYEPCP